MLIERLDFYGRCPKCNLDAIESGFMINNGDYHIEEWDCFNCGHHWEVKVKIYNTPVLNESDIATTPPDELAEKLVYALRRTSDSQIVYSSDVIDKFYKNKKRALAATVQVLKDMAKLKEVER